MSHDNTVRKFEFVNDKGVFSVIETDPKTHPKDIPKDGDGRFCRTWLGTKEAYRVKSLRVSDSPFVKTLCVKGGWIKIKNKDYVTV